MTTKCRGRRRRPRGAGGRARCPEPRSTARLVDVVPLIPLQVDTEVQRDIWDVLLAEDDLVLVFGLDLDAQGQSLQLLDQDPEGFRDAGLEGVLALDDGLVRLDPADDVVRLDGEDLLADVAGSVRLEGPDLHFSEALTAKLRLASQRLLGDQGVGTGAPGVDLVLDQMGQLQHVDLPDRDLAVKGLPRPMAQG